MKAYYKGDTLQFHVTVDTDITAWALRAEIFDSNGNSFKVASIESGGSDDQIAKVYISLTSSVFVVYIPSGETTYFLDDCTLEIEADTGETIGGKPEIITIYKNKLELTEEQIYWTTP